MSATRIWIMDGHNMIFAIGGLQSLQVSGRGEEARRGLVDRLRRFAQARGQQVLIVFDGIDLPSNPDALREPLLEVAYARRREGAADNRIIHEARSRTERGHRVSPGVLAEIHRQDGRSAGQAGRGGFLGRGKRDAGAGCRGGARPGDSAGGFRPARSGTRRRGRGKSRTDPAKEREGAPASGAPAQAASQALRDAMASSRMSMPCSNRARSMLSGGWIRTNQEMLSWM
ncbi:MAG: hypothetical protein DMF51_05585 [Acidobacteria bacterium]|nr:MAG: hypothetical protein DMF51_05585 [Acidobacteriota bacterium]